LWGDGKGREMGRGGEYNARNGNTFEGKDKKSKSRKGRGNVEGGEGGDRERRGRKYRLSNNAVTENTIFSRE
jgi:hypothetical protein